MSVLNAESQQKMNLNTTMLTDMENHKMTTEDLHKRLSYLTFDMLFSPAFKDDEGHERSVYTMLRNAEKELANRLNLKQPFTKITNDQHEKTTINQ